MREINEITKIDDFFLCKINELVLMEEKLKTVTLESISPEMLRKAKKMGFTDSVIAELYRFRQKDGQNKANRAWHHSSIQDG